MKNHPSVDNEEFLNDLTFEPLAIWNWGKFEELFGEKGACGNCWCMYYRLNKPDFTEGKFENGNKMANRPMVRFYTDTEK